MKVAKATEDTMILEIDGLREIGGGRFELSGVRQFQVEWPKVEEILTEAGMDRRTAMEHTERFADKVFQTELAKAIAERCRRAG